jgi:hypothetical protein
VDHLQYEGYREAGDEGHTAEYRKLLFPHNSTQTMDRWNNTTGEEHYDVVKPLVIYDEPSHCVNNKAKRRV